MTRYRKCKALGRRLGTGVLICLPALAQAFELDFNVITTRDDVREALRETSLLRAEKEDGESDPRDVIASASAEYAQLLNALYGKGHYGGVISIKVDGREVSDIPPTAYPARIDRVSVRVDAGPRFRFSEAVVDPVAPDTLLPEGFRKGGTAESELIRETAVVAVDGWRNAGHAKAELVDQRFRADHASNRLSAILRIAPGPKLKFGNVRVLSKSAVRGPAIRRIAGVPKGETFSPDELRKSAQRLRRTGAFRSVTLREAEEIGPDNTLATEIEVVDAKPRRFGFGAELTSLEGITLSGFWLHRNLTGAADRLRLEAEAGGLAGDTGGIDYHLGLDYRYPAIYGADTDAFLRLNLDLLDEPEFYSEQFDLAIGASRIVTEDITAEAALDYRYSEVQDAFGDRVFELYSLPVTFTQDVRDDVLNPTDGRYVRASATPFYDTGRENFGSRFQLDFRAYRGLATERDTILAGRLQLGTVTGVGLDEVPPDFLFFSGGGGTVRGQPYQSLTIPQNGDDSGGQSFAALSLEMRREVRDNIQLVGFADMGWISGEAKWQGEGVSHAGAGIGARYITSFGPIRFDVAGPVSGDTGEGVQIYIGIGQAF